MAPSKSSASTRSGKAPGDVLAGARIDAAATRPPVRPRAADRLHADAVPLPLGQEVGRVELVEILVLERMRQHRRAERGRDRVASGCGAAALDPGEQRLVGRLQPVPDLLDVVGLDAAEAAATAVLASRAETPMRKLAGDQLQQRPAPGLVEGVEPARRAGAGRSALGSAGLRGASTTSASEGGGRSWRAGRACRRPRALDPAAAGSRRWPAGAGQISATVSARSPT